MPGRLKLFSLVLVLVLVNAIVSPAPAQSSLGGQFAALPVDRWREWPVVPELSVRAIEILQAAAQNPDLDGHTFSKLGDCQFTPATFLAGYVLKPTEGTCPTPVFIYSKLLDL